MFRSISSSSKISVWIFWFVAYEHQYAKNLFTTLNMVIDKLMKILKKAKLHFGCNFMTAESKQFNAHKLLVYQCRGVRKIAVFWHNSDFTDTFKIQIFIKHSTTAYFKAAVQIQDYCYVNTETEEVREWLTNTCRERLIFMLHIVNWVDFGVSITK